MHEDEVSVFDVLLSIGMVASTLLVVILAVLGAISLIVWLL